MSSTIKLGSLDISAINLGSTAVTALYQGATQIWPGAIAGLFPNQAIQVWSATETAQWLSAAGTVFASGNGVTYGAFTSVSSALGTNMLSGCMAKNGKIYMGGDNGTGLVNIWDTNTNTMTSITMPGPLIAYGAAVYNDYSKCVYIAGSYCIYVIDTLTDTYVTTITQPLGGQYSLLYSSGYDAKYIYGNGWFINNTWFSIDCDTNTAVSLTPQTSGGDTLAGVMAQNGKLYMGGGGGSTSGFHVFDTNTNTNQFVSAMGNISDQYRGAAVHYNGYVYTLPAYGASSIWQINPATNGATVVATGVTDNRPIAHILGADGQIYGFGNSGQATIYNPITNAVSYLTIPTINVGWVVMDKDANMYVGQTTNLYKIPASGVPSVTLAAMSDMNSNIARMRSY